MKRILVALLLFAAAGVQAQTPSQPLMLVASPTLQGFYSRAVLVVLPAGEAHVGFILNRATRIPLKALFPRHAPSAKVVDPVHLGGPEMVDSLFAVVRSNPGADAAPLFGGLYLASSAEAVDRVIERAPRDARFFAGFVGWRAGELDDEIDAGYWHVTDADPALFFRPDTTGLWDELVERLGNGHPPQRGRGFQVTGLSR
jgi:putative transcriptional regulator